MPEDNPTREEVPCGFGSREYLAVVVLSAVGGTHWYNAIMLASDARVKRAVAEGKLEALEAIYGEYLADRQAVEVIDLTSHPEGWKPSDHLWPSWIQALREQYQREARGEEE